MKIIGTAYGFTVIHLKRRFFLFFERKTKNIFIVELARRKRKTENQELGGEHGGDGKNGNHDYSASTTSTGSISAGSGIAGKELEEIFADIYERWEIKITPLHFLLFLLTFISTTVAGAMIQGINPLSKDVWKGIYFSAPLLFILSCHEFGHIYAMWKYGVRSTFPYFIPAPNIVGTFGAIMVLRERVERASVIIKVGASGPIFGFIAALPVAFIGVYLSDIVSFEGVEGEGFFIRLGSSLIFKLIESIFYHDIPEKAEILLHPVAFAGWIGFFITAINLIPIGQTDGGHILFGLFPKYHRKVSFALALTLFFIGFLFWYGWIIWAILTLILGLRKIPFVPKSDITGRERLIAFISLVIFLLTFMFSPITIAGY